MAKSTKIATGLYKRSDICPHGRAAWRTCGCEWSGNYQKKGTRARTPLHEYANRPVTVYTDAVEVFEALKQAVRDGEWPRPKGAPVTAAGVLTVDAMIANYLEQRPELDRSAKACCRAFGAFVLEGLPMGLRAVETVTTVQVEAFFATLRDRAKATQRFYHSAIHTMWEHQMDRDKRVTSSPFRNERGKTVIKPPKGFVVRDRILEDDEEPVLLMLARRLYPRMVPCWIALLDTALRYNELITLQMSDIDFARGTIRVRAENAKTGKERRFAIMTERLRKVLTTASLDAAGDPKGANAYVFCDGSGDRPHDFLDQAHRLLKIAHGEGKLIGFWLRDTRATCLTRLLGQGVAPSDVLTISGHASYAMLVRYDRQNRLKTQERTAAALQAYVSNLSQSEADTELDPAA